MADNSNDRSQALVRIADAYPEVIDITPGSDMTAGSSGPMGLMKNITPGSDMTAGSPDPMGYERINITPDAGAGSGVGAAAAAITGAFTAFMSPFESVITLLGVIHDSLEKIENVLGDILFQDERIADGELAADAEAIQDANEAASRVRPVEAPEEDDRPWPKGKQKKEKESKKSIFDKLMALLGFGAITAAFTTFTAALSTVGAAISAFALPVIATVAVLWAGYEIFKRVDWSSFVVPLENAFTMMKDVALSVWDVFGKIVDVIDVAFMPIMRFLIDLIQPQFDKLAVGLGTVVDGLTIWWEDDIKPLVEQFGEGLVTVKNFFKGIQDLRGADLRDAIIGGFMHMIDSLWDAMARSRLGKFFGMDTNEEKRAQEFEDRRQSAMEQYTEREGVDSKVPFMDTGIMALPENERAAARAESDAQLKEELAQITSDEDAANAVIDARDAASDATIVRGERMDDTAGPIRQGLGAVGIDLPPQATGDAYAGLTIKGSGGGTQTGGGGQATEGGPVEPGVIDFASAIQPNVDGFTRFTAFNDNFHQASNTSLHAKGLALDFTVDDPSKAPAAAATVRRLADEAGVPSGGVDVIDEYNNPSSNATAGHIHAEFNSKEDAMKMAAGGLDSSPTLVPGAPAGRGGGDGAGGTGSLNAAAQLPGAPGASRSGAGVGTATSDLASQGAAAPVMVAIPGGQPLAPPAPPPVITIPIPMNARNEEQVHRALHSVNYV